MPTILPVLIAAPAHASLPAVLSYTSEQALAAGSLVRVPLGSREVLGIVWSRANEPSEQAGEYEMKPILSVVNSLTPLSAAWCALVDFAGRYYQRSAGEVALASLPPQLREMDADQWQRREQRQAKKEAKAAKLNVVATESSSEITIKKVAASAHQSRVLDQFFDEKRASEQPALLFGVTGSGKTEVYLRCIEKILEADEKAQALIMVPEINLTPQLEAIVRARFAHWPPTAVVSLHSGLAPAERLASWLGAHSGQARIMLATRMGIFASLPNLRLIVVDEEHDASYRSQEGARHSARDLAVMRAKLETQHSHEGQPCRILLGSATPSLESWQAASLGRYALLSLPERIGQAVLPELRLADMGKEPRGSLFSAAVLTQLRAVVARGQQSLVFLNRRGYAPVLACDACGWKCACPHCSAYRVYHRIDRMLRCHHCGHTERVPRACPECGNLDIQPLGRGTQKIEEELALALGADCKRTDGQSPKILRIDADSARLKGALQQQLAQVHGGEVDILVGTQMVTKGHDFRRIGLVLAIDADAALFSTDFRAPERLFALLMQAAGRAGRDAALNAGDGSSAAAPPQMWVQTRHPDHPLFKFLAQQDFAGFAKNQLQQRNQALLPPFSYQALLRAEARSQEAAQQFLNHASEQAQSLIDERLSVFPPVPMSLQRVANIERAQMLIESSSRALLQNFLTQWLPLLRQSKPKSLIRFALDVDPIQI